MGTFYAKNAGDSHPSIIPNRAGEVIAEAKMFEMASLNGAPLAVGDIIKLVKLPADCVVVDGHIDSSGIAGLALDVGLLNKTGDGTGAELLAAASLVNTATTCFSVPQFSRLGNEGSADEWLVGVVTAGSAAIVGDFELTVLYRNRS